MSDMGSAQNNISKAMSSILDQDYTPVGKHIVEDIAKGIKQAINYALVPALKSIADMLPHSPAKTGPLSKPVDWESYLTFGLSSALGNIGLTGSGVKWATPGQEGTTINMGGITVTGGGLDSYRVAQQLVTAAEQVASSRGMNITRAGYRR